MVQVWWQLGESFFLIGLLGFGGGFGMIPLMKSVTLSHHWLTTHEFTQAVALGQITPGPVAISAAFIGEHAGGWMGGLIATMAVFTPSVLVVILLSYVYRWIRKWPASKTILNATLAGVVGLIAAVTIELGQSVITQMGTWVIAIIVAIGVIRWKWPYWLIILISGVVGALFLRT